MERRCGSHTLEEILCPRVAIILKQQHYSSVREGIPCQEEQRNVRDAKIGQLRVRRLSQECCYARLYVLLPTCGLIWIDQTASVE